jgi:hypothetical protein
MMTDEEIAEEQELIKQQKKQEDEYVINNSITDEDAQSVTPFDLLNSNNYTSKDVRNQRYDICKSCERFLNPIKMCRECGCNMPLKTWLKDAECPIGKWGHE